MSLDFGYDENGYRNLVKDSLGGEERSTYNAHGQLLSRTLKQGTTYLRIDFTYTAAGQVETQTRYSDLAGSTLVAKTTYSYDGKYRLLSIVTVDDNDDPIDSFEYMCRTELWSHSLPNWGCKESGLPEARFPNCREFWRRGARRGSPRFDGRYGRGVAELFILA